MEVHGSIPGEQVYSFDGLKLNWPGFTGGFTAFYIDYDALQEFQVVTDTAPAEVSVGGVYMNMVTKSGSNQLHGTLAGYYTTSALVSQINEPRVNGQPINAGSPFIMLRDTSANAGGPLIKDRWWLFGSYRRYDIKERVLFVVDPIADTNHQSNTVLRTDVQISRKNRVNFNWLYNEQNRFARRDKGPAFVTAQASWRQIEPAYILQGEWTSFLNPNLVLDTRLGYMHLLFPLSYQDSVKPTDIAFQDLTLSTQTGAAIYNFLNPAQALRFATSASYYKSKLGGTHNFKFGFEDSTNRNGNFFDANGGILALLSNGVPSNVEVYNFPVREQSIFHESGLFFQDSWSVNRRLTLNLGLRYDHFRAFNPKQSSPASPFFPSLFPQRTFSQSPDVVSWNNVVPRIGAAFDVTGKGTSVLRFGYSRFNKIEGTELGEAVNPNGFGGEFCTWNDVDGDGFPQQSEFLSSACSPFGGIVTRIDPHLKRPYSEQINAGYEHEVTRGLRVGATYYYRSTKRLISQRNEAIQPSDYTPITTLNGSPITDLLTNQPLTLFNVNAAKASLADILVTNITALDDNTYHALEITAGRRMSQNWQLLAGFTAQRNKGSFTSSFLNGAASDDFNDPNRNINRQNAVLNLDATYVFKVDGTYRMPRVGISVSANYQHYTGYPLQLTEFFSQGLNQPAGETIILEPIGRHRLPNVDLLNLRFSRPTRLSDRFAIEPIVDLFNITNSNSVTSEVTSFGGNNFRNPVNTLNPRDLRFGVKVNF